MRESLTIFAIALIALLSALLVGPYLVDWNGQRDWLAAKLSDAVGAQVRIGGTVDVKLLPRPLFRATDVSIAGAAPQDPALSAAGLDAELSINSLLQGAVEFIDATALRPRLTVTARDDGSLVGGAWDVSNPQRFTFRHIRIRDGALVVRDPAGRQRSAIVGLDAEGEAETLFGPVRLAGQGTAEGGTFRFRLTTGAYAGHRLRVKLVTDDLKPFAHADLDGTLALAPGADRTGAALSFTGDFTGTGSLRVADGFAPVPWQVTAGGLKADGKGASTAALELRAGADARALVANGAALVDFGTTPSVALQLKARQLDLDRIAVAPEVAPDTPRPRAAQWIAAMQDLAGQGGGAPGRLTLDWTVDAVTRGDLTLTDAKGALALAPGAPARGRFNVNGPDGFRLLLDGALERGAGAVYKGRIEAATRNLPATAAWLAPLQPAAADWLAEHPGAQDVALAGNFDLSATGAAARDLTLTVDGATVSGAAALTRGVGAEPPRLFADLRADTLDTGRLPSLADLASLGDGVDMSVGVAARTVRLARAGLSDVTAGPLSAHLTKAGEAVTLDGFTLGGLDGASVSASGTLAADRRLAAQGRIAAPDVAPLATLLRQFLPGAATDGFAARAALLSPLALDWSLAGTLDRDGHLSPTLATAKGHAAATAVSATITPEPARLFASPAVSLLAVLDAPDGGALLGQLGFGAPNGGRLQAPGPGHVELTARGTPQAGYDTHMAATLAGATLGFDGHAEAAEGTGRGKATGRDAGALLSALGLPQSGAGAAQPWDLAADVRWNSEALRADGLTGHVAGATVSGALARAADTGAVTGTLVLDALPLPGLAALLLGQPPTLPPAQGRSFSAAPFAPAPPTPFVATVAMQVGRLDLGQTLGLGRAAFTLKLAPGALALTDLRGAIAGGTAGGTLTLRRDGATASLSGQLRLDGATLAWPSLTGTLSGSLALAGSGSSPDALAASLAGDGAVSFTGALPHFDPQALATVATAGDVEGATLDPEVIRTALSTALDRAPLDLGTLAGPVTLAAGTLRTGVLRDALPAGALQAEAGYNLLTGQASLRATFAAAALPREWKGDPPAVTVTWKGPPAAMVRTVDAGAFANGLAARAIQREQDRIELMQDDLRERAFFARRLRAMDEARAAREAAARAAAEKAKAAAQPPSPPTRPTAADPVAKLLQELPAPPAVPPVPPTRPSEPNDAQPADAGASDRFKGIY